jgi:hypothetical protein
MSEYEKQKWLEQLADKYEVPYEQVMLAWAVYEVTTEYANYPKPFEEVLMEVFNNF